MEGIMERVSKLVRMVAAMVVGMGMTFGVTALVARAEDDDRATVIHRDAVVYGNTYGEWAARYTQWAFAVPAASVDPAADCGVGQQGPVWFLPSTFGSDPFTRECTVPAGKALFFTLASVIFGAGVLDCEPTNPGVPCNLATLRTSASAVMNDVALEATLDGRPLRRLRQQRVQTPVFALTHPADNFFALAAGTYDPNVADGYFVMLAPLRPGAHTIHAKATFPDGFVIDVTTHVTVVH
jgi:hypothetical protein